jgi:PASTA domain-containing protein
VMREHYPKVLAANRFFEEETGIHNELGANNLNDALSHLGTLFEQAGAMSSAQQAHEVHDFEGHLRRGMMESYEQVFRLRMGEVEKLWREHERVARPLQAEGRLRGVPSLDELARLRRRCKLLLDDGRSAKRGHDWAAWDKGTEALAEACRTATELADALEACTAAAQQQTKQRRGFRFGLAWGALLTLIGVPLGFLGNELLSDDSTRVPDVVGQPVPQAVVELANADLRIHVSGSTSPTGARCRVAALRPRPGRELSTDSVVTVVARCSRSR